MKKSLSILLALCMIVVMCPTAMAETQEVPADVFHSLNLSQAEQAAALNDIAMIEDHGIYAEQLIEIVPTDAGLLYRYQVASAVSEIRVETDQNGNTILYITEGALSDIVCLSRDNKIYINGKEATTSYTSSEAGISPFRDSSFWRTEVCPYGKPQEYTKFQYTEAHADVAFEAYIDHMTLTAIVLVLDTVFPGYGSLLSAFAEVVRLLSEDEPGKSTSASFKAHHYYHTKGYYVDNSAGMLLGVDKVILMCYVQPNYKGASSSYVYYECKSQY